MFDLTACVHRAHNGVRFRFTPLCGSSGAPGASPAAQLKARNAIQAQLVNGSRLGIPASFSQEALHSSTKGGTVFPELVTQGSSWDPELVRDIAAAIAVEARAVGVDVAFSPVLNQWVDSRFGRLQACREPASPSDAS